MHLSPIVPAIVNTGSITIQQGMTYRQVQQVVEARWPLLTIVFFFPTPGFYKVDRLVEEAYVEPDYRLTTRMLKPDSVVIWGDMAESTVRDLFYDIYDLEANIAYRYNPYGRRVPGATLDHQQETVQRWWDTFEQHYNRPPDASDVFVPLQD